MEDTKLSEEDQIKEYERLVEFARQVQEGVHPRVKIPRHQLHKVKSTRVVLTDIALDVNYYNAIGVRSNATQKSITRAYGERWNNFSPLSTNKGVIAKWNSENLSVIQKVKEKWNLLQLAYKILSDPDLRAYYDRNRDGVKAKDSSTPNSQPLKAREERAEEEQSTVNTYLAPTKSVSREPHVERELQEEVDDSRHQQSFNITTIRKGFVPQGRVEDEQNKVEDREKERVELLCGRVTKRQTRPRKCSVITLRGP